MGYPTKVQLIQRKESQQWYINFPAAIAQGMDFEKGDNVEWTIADKGNLILSRKRVPPHPIDLKKTLRSSKN
jgi:antitoxin component of MazEF toxin-antitoxin module